MLNYFARNGAPCPADTNPAEHIVEVIQGNTKRPVDWVDVWEHSPEREDALKTLQELNATATPEVDEADSREYATSKWTQFRVVLHRLMTQLWRSPVSFLITDGSPYPRLAANISARRTTSGIRSTCTYSQPFSGASPSGRWATALSTCSFACSPSSTSSS